MINRLRSATIRKYATREMLSSSGCEHAIYGVCYITPGGNIVQELATTPSEIKYFYSDASFDEYVNSLYKTYDEVKQLDIYAVHRQQQYV